MTLFGIKTLGKSAVAAVALLGAAMFASAPAKADVGFGISFGYDGGYFSDPCDYYDYYDQAPPWGLPPDYCEYPVYFEPVYYGGSWYRGPIYYRWYGGDRMYWLNGGWRRDEWRGSRPSGIRWSDRGGWHGRDGWNNRGRGGFRDDRGWDNNRGWGNDRGWGGRSDFRDDHRGGRDNFAGRSGDWNRGGSNSASQGGNWPGRGYNGGGQGTGYQGGGYQGGGQSGGQSAGWSGGHSGGYQGGVGRGGWSGGHGGGGQGGGGQGGGGQGGGGGHHGH